MGRRGDREWKKGEAKRKRGVKAIEEKRMSYTEINSKTLKGFNINNPGLGGTACSDLSETLPGESDERTEKAHLRR